jgi:1-aminocyclopropane-1-carboxylate deaminase/D-cysteine desulfhydrase-like pyridoxal-dependent ACC family enzyme
MARVVDELETAGEVPYLVPTGGSVPIGALGYMNCVVELQDQLDALRVIPRRLYFPTGSQGTQAGLAAGALLFDAPYEVRGIAVEATTAELAAEGVPLTNETLQLMGSDLRVDSSDISIDDRHVGQGYAIPTPAGMEAIGLLARTEAIVLEPVYTGKALAGLISDVRAGDFEPNDVVIFLHTGGGPSVFANLDAYAALFDK